MIVPTGYHTQNKHNPKISTHHVRIPRFLFPLVADKVPFFIPGAGAIVFLDKDMKFTMKLSLVGSSGKAVDSRIGTLVLETSYLITRPNCPSKSAYYVRIPRPFYNSVVRYKPVFEVSKLAIVLVTDNELKSLLKGSLTVDLQINPIDGDGAKRRGKVKMLLTVTELCQLGMQLSAVAYAIGSRKLTDKYIRLAAETGLINIENGWCNTTKLGRIALKNGEPRIRRLLRKIREEIENRSSEKSE